LRSPSNDNSQGRTASDKCLICNAEMVKTYSPFCSKRCADVDLHRWLSGRYAIPASDDDSDGTRADVDEA